jgi:hypothetical protein
MKMYLLLRNNKQSGPHSVDDLKSMGLKAYDLVWLEGKSAAWRYPSEIEELSSFAPAVEEQPFDRFFKRPSAAASTAGANNSNDTGVSFRPTTQIPVAIESQSPKSSPVSSPMSPGKRIIYVTMPAGKSPAGRETTRDTSIREMPVREPAFKETPAREPAFREPPTETNHRETSPHEPIMRETTASYARAAIEDYSAQPSAGQTTLVDYLPRRKSPKTRTITRFVAVGFCILALLAAGIFIGLSLNRDTLGLPQKMVANNAIRSNGATGSGASPNSLPNGSTTNAEQPIVHPTVQQLQVPAVMPPSASTHQETAPAPATTPAVATRSVKTSLKTRQDRSAHGSVQYTTAPATKDSATTAIIPAMQREAVHRSDNAETHHDNLGTVDNEALRTALANQISVGANSYSVGTFGGINDLQVTVTNRSAYPLDLVVVEVQYIQANKKVFKTEELHFRGVGAGSALMLEAPKSSRGIKVQYKVTTINSREFGLPGA